MKWIYCLLLLLCPYMNSAQVKALRVGDTLPHLVIERVHNSLTGTVTIPALNGMYTIIDCWASSCRSCIEGFDNMHTLQSLFKDSLQVLMVNCYERDSAAKVNKLFASLQKRTGLLFTLPFILQDTLLRQLFPFEYLPHCIWISPAGRIDAITGAEELTAGNIRTWLRGCLPALAMKNDALRYNPAIGLLPAEDTTGTVLYRSVITAGKKELGASIGRRVNDAGLVTRLYMINSSLPALYRFAFPVLDSIPFRQVQYDTAVRALFNDHNTGKPLTYSYEYTGRAVPAGQLRPILQHTLEQCFGIVPVVQQLPVDCYILTAAAGAHQLRSRGGRPLTDADTLGLHPGIINQPLSELLAVVGSLLPLTLIDETGIGYPVDISLPKGFHHYTVPQLQAWLQRHGLVLTPATRTLPVAVWQQVQTLPTDHSPKQTIQ